MKRPTPTQAALIAVCLLAAIALYVLNCLTPLYFDDFAFQFFYAPEHLLQMPGFGWMGPYVEHFAGVARFVPHLAVAFFSLVAGKAVFNVVCVAGFALLCWLIARVAARERAQVFPLAAVTAAAMWFVMPGFFQAVMWMSGACNYLFPAILILTFYLWFTRSVSGRARWLTCVAGFVFGFITGWTNEGFVVGLAGGCTLYALLHRSEMRGVRLWLYIGLVCGAVPLCLSPFNIHRFMEGHSGGIGDTAAGVAGSLITLTDIYMTFMLAAAAAGMALTARKRRHEVAAFVRRNMILLTALAVSFVFIVLTRHTSPYSRFPMETYSLVLLMALAARLPLRALRGTAVVLSAAMLATMAALLPKAAANMTAYKSMRAQILDDSAPCIVLDDVPLNAFEKRYIKHTSYLPWLHNPVENGDIIVEHFGGRPGRPMIPRYVADHLYDAPLWHIAAVPSWSMRWVRVPAGTEVTDVRLSLKPARLHAWQRPLARFFSSMTIDETDALGFRTLVVNGHDGPSTWLAVYDTPAVASRISGLRATLRR